MRYVNTIIRCLVALIPALGAIVENILGKAKAKPIQADLDYVDDMLLAINDLIRHLDEALAKEGAGGKSITPDELDNILLGIRDLALLALPYQRG